MHITETRDQICHGLKKGFNLFGWELRAVRMEGRKLYGAFPAFTHVSVRWTDLHRKSLLFYHLVLTSRQSHSLEAVSLKGTWFVIRIHCQGEKVPSPTQMPGRGWCQTVTGPSFSATVIALCTGGKMPGQLLGKLPAALQGPKLWGNFRLRWVEERELHHVVSAIFRESLMGK